MPVINKVAAGTGGTGALGNGTNGIANGTGIYLENTNLVTVANQTTIINDNISGVGNVTKSGQGNLVFNGLKDAVGTTTVNAGVLSVNGKVIGATTVNAGLLSVNGTTDGAVNVLAPGTLSGNGNVGATTVSGTVAPGNSIGTLHVNGNYVQNAGSTYQVEISPSGASDLIAVNGAAQINGGIVQVLTGNGLYRNNQVFTILTATGGVSGGFNSILGTAPGYFNASLLYHPNDIQIYLRSNLRQLVGITFNQISFATYLDGVTSQPGTDLDDVIAALRNLPPDQARRALDQMSGTQYASLITLGRLRAMYQNQLLSDQIRSNLFTGSILGNGVARGAMPDEDDCVEIDRGLKSWLKAYGLGGQVGTDGNAAGLTYQFAGFLGGIEKQLSDTTRVGLTAGYNATTAQFRGLYGNTSADGFIGGLYASQTFGQAYVFGSATYGFNDFTVKRQITFPGVSRVANAEVDQNDLNGYLETGYTQDVGSLRVQPLVGLQYLNLHQNGFGENGAGALNLNVEDQSTTALWGMAGVRLGMPFCTEHGRIIPQVHGKFVHDFLGEDRFVAGALSGVGGSYLVQGVGAGNNYFVGGGFALERGRNFRILVDYTVQASTKQTSHTGNGGVQVSW